MSLLRRSLLLVGLALAPAVLIQVSNEIESRHEREADVRQQVLQQAQAANSDLNQFFEGVRQLLVTLSLLPAVRGDDPEACGKLLQIVVREDTRYLNIATAGVDGRIRCTARPRVPGDTMVSQPVFKAIETNSFTIGEYALGRTVRTPLLRLSYPIRDEAHAVTGVIWVAVKLEAFGHSVADRMLPPDMLLMATDRRGTILAASPAGGAWIGSGLPAAMRALLDAPGPGTAEAAGPDGVERIFGYVPPTMPPAGVFIAIGMDKQAAFAQIDRALWRGVALILAGVALAIAAALVGSRQLLQKPIAALLAAAGRWRAGDYSARANLRAGIAEISTLGDTFDGLADALAAREQDLVAAKQRAEERAAAAERSEQQKLVLLREVNHRVKNSLQLVSSLLSLQASSIGDAGVGRQFREASRRVQTVARVHQRLYQSDNFESVELGRYLEDLCAELTHSFARDGKSPRCEVESVRVELPTDRMIPLALVVNELVTNSFKYASPDGGVRVAIACRRVDGGLQVDVADDGVGLPAGFDLDRNGGLGLRIVSALVAQLDGCLAVDRAGKGARFRVTVPLGAPPA